MIHFILFSSFPVIFIACIAMHQWILATILVALLIIVMLISFNEYTWDSILLYFAIASKVMLLATLLDLSIFTDNNAASKYILEIYKERVL